MISESEKFSQTYNYKDVVEGTNIVPSSPWIPISFSVLLLNFQLLFGHEIIYTCADYCHGAVKLRSQLKWLIISTWAGCFCKMLPIPDLWICSYTTRKEKSVSFKSVTSLDRSLNGALCFPKQLQTMKFSIATKFYTNVLSILSSSLLHTSTFSNRQSPSTLSLSASPYLELFHTCTSHRTFKTRDKAS